MTSKYPLPDYKSSGSGSGSGCVVVKVKKESSSSSSSSATANDMTDDKQQMPPPPPVPIRNKPIKVASDIAALLQSSSSSTTTPKMPPPLSVASASASATATASATAAAVAPTTPTDSAAVKALRLKQSNLIAGIMSEAQPIERSLQHRAMTYQQHPAEYSTSIFDSVFNVISSLSPLFMETTAMGKALATGVEYKVDSKTKQENVEKSRKNLPCHKSGFEDRLLYEGGVSRVSPQNPNRQIISPACCNKEKCVNFMYPPEWGQPVTMGDEEKRKPFVLMVYMSPEELDDHEKGNDKNKTLDVFRARKCIRCERRAVDDSVSMIGMTGARVDTTIWFQNWYNLVDIDDGYKSEYILPPETTETRFNGLILPIVGSRADGYRSFYSTKHGCRVVSQELMKWKPHTRMVDPLTKAELSPDSKLPTRNF